jgi:hypothetical protein
MTLRLRISSLAGNAETPSHTATFLVRMGFQAPIAAFTKNAVLVEVEREEKWRRRAK